MSDTQYMVNIPMCVYNHGRFIGQTIESVLNQKTNFRYRLLIGEDCSTDNSREIIRKYLPGNEDKITAFFREKNVGAAENSRLLFKECTAKYIAFLDGDDYWTDPEKLQRQIDFLEANPDVAACYHNAEVVNDSGFVRLYNNLSQETRLSQDEVVRSLEIPTASMVFRNCVQDLPQWLLDFCMDITLYYYIAGFGDFYGLPRVMSAYRIHDGGIWTGQDEEKKLTNHIRIRKNMIDKLPLSKVQERSVRQIILNVRLQRMSHLANRYLYNGTFFKDLFNVIRGKLTGYSINGKFLIFCMLPGRFVSFVNGFRRSGS